MSSLDTSHECPAPGCSVRVPFEIFACKAHWFTISTSARWTLLREYRRNFGQDSYFAARAECLRQLGVAEAEIAEQNGGFA